jgi:hypothetical protein
MCKNLVLARILSIIIFNSVLNLIDQSLQPHTLKVSLRLLKLHLGILQLKLVLNFDNGPFKSLSIKLLALEVGLHFLDPLFYQLLRHGQIQ